MLLNYTSVLGHNILLIRRLGIVLALAKLIFGTVNAKYNLSPGTNPQAAFLLNKGGTLNRKMVEDIVEIFTYMHRSAFCIVPIVDKNSLELRPRVRVLSCVLRRVFVQYGNPCKKHIRP